MRLAHAVGTAGLVIGAGCLLVACAGAQPASVAARLDLSGMTTLPAPRSTLISRPDLRFHLAQRRSGISETTVLVHDPPSGAPVPAAAIIASGERGPRHVSVERLALPSAEPGLEVAVLENLYVLAVAQEPTASFCLAEQGAGCDPARHGESHAQLLKQIVAAREAALRGPQDASAAHWQMLTMSPAPKPGTDPDQVAVRVALDQRPFQGAQVYFNRAPHSGCVARSDAGGIAACKLVDYHGDEGDEHEADVPVVATFSGDVRPGRVLVPATFELPADAQPNVAGAAPR